MSVFFSTFTIMENILLYFCCICCITFFALKMFIKIGIATSSPTRAYNHFIEQSLFMDQYDDDLVVARIPKDWMLFFSLLEAPSMKGFHSTGPLVDFSLLFSELQLSFSFSRVWPFHTSLLNMSNICCPLRR